MRNKSLLEKIAHRYNLNGIKLDGRAVSMCNFIKPGMYRIHWYDDNTLDRFESLDGYSYETIGGYYYLNQKGSSSPFKLASSEFIDLKLDEIRNNIIDEIFE